MNQQRYLVLLSVHGLIRGKHLELGRDADTGGQTLYVVELARALARQPGVARVDLLTRLVDDPAVAPDYAVPLESLGGGAHIVRIAAGPPGYIPKEQLWDHLDAFADNAMAYFDQQGLLPDIIHSHYADAGYVGTRLASRLGVPLVHTGHSLGRVKRRQLLASGLSADEIEMRYNMTRRIEAEELTLASAERVITSTHQEISEQYEIYDHYQPDQMRVIPPGTDTSRFVPAQGDELQGPLFDELARFLNEPSKPMILALSRPDRRKNIPALVKAYGESPELQALANLVIVAGNRDDIEELDAGMQEVFSELLLAIDRYDLYGRVAYPKHHRREQVPMFFRMAATSGGVFVNPALTEPFGLTLIEAAACGLPIVATDDGGPRDIIANCQNGLLVDVLDTDAIRNALLTMLTDRVFRQRCAENGVSGVREHYAWESHARRYMAVVEPIMERSELLVRQPIFRRGSTYVDRAIFTDLDQNLLGDRDSLQQLMTLLRTHRNQAKLGIATGRRLDSALKALRQYGIPMPDILITSGGTEIHYAPRLTADSYWHKHIDYQWMPQRVRAALAGVSGLTLQPREEQSRFKISYFIDTAEAPSLEEINRLLHREELSVNVSLSFGQYLDVMPIRASKGFALRYVLDRWRIPLDRTLVAGGSGADEDMMRGNTLAVVVANRHHEELSQLVGIERIYFASQPCAAGIIEAMTHYDFYGGCQAPQVQEDEP